MTEQPEKSESAEGADTSTPCLDLVGGSIVLSLATRRLGLRPWQLTCLVFAGYYLLPLLASLRAGALLPEGFVETQLSPFGLGWLAEWVPHDPSITQPYATDFVHLLMALVSILGGGTIALRAVLQFEEVFANLINSGQLGATRIEIRQEVARANRLLRSWPVRGLLLLVATPLAAFMVGRALDPEFAGWWGQISHGVAGLVFAIAAWALMFFGGLYLFFLAVGLHTLTRLFRHPVTMRPFHPDECNGFGEFGTYLLTLAGLAVLIGGAIWITFWGGYLGVELLVLTWIGGLIGIAFIPVIVILPLARLTMQIGAARDRRVAGVERVLHARLTGIESALGLEMDDQTLATEMDRLVSTRRAVREIYPAYPFPFKPRIAGILGTGYVIQVGLLVNRAMSTFGWF